MITKGGDYDKIKERRRQLTPPQNATNLPPFTLPPSHSTQPQPLSPLTQLNFLLLDDAITEGNSKTINLQDEDVDAITSWDHDDVEFGRGAHRPNRRTSGMSNRRLSNASAISKGSQALNASLVADIGASGLRLMSSDVDRSGALLLPGSNAFGQDDEGDEYDVGNEDDLEDGFDMGDDEGFGMGDDGRDKR